MYIISHYDADWADSHADRKSTTEYCTFIGGNLVNWRNKKENVVIRSSAKAKYQASSNLIRIDVDYKYDEQPRY